MTRLDIKLEFPDDLAKQARAEGLLTSKALSKILKEAIRRRAGWGLLAGAARASAAGNRPMSMEKIQAEVNAVRRARKASKHA